ncbi:hypothetical protein [Wolbachia endosymbiont (group A) of Clivina fossor]|uniref:hypothetical protein n=1 Tax=Wolbachia endosymbiont (group A) of Clivina fossor TaxID=3066133 RepID=UPI003132DE72
MRFGIREELFPALENIDGMQSENISYFEQMCKLNLLRIISPIIKDVDFKSLLFNNPEKLVKDQSLLENVFASVESLVSDKYKQQQLQYEDFENLENQINEEILNKSGETEGIANQDVSKTDLSNYVFESVGLSLLMGQDIEVSTDLQKRIYYETLINLGSLIHDHKNHIQITHNGDQHTPHIDSLVERVKSSKLLSVAHDLYYLHKKDEDNVDQSNLYSDKVKSKINLYGSINSEYKLNDIHNKFDIDEIKSYFSEDELKKFGAEFEAYDKEVITIHSPQVFTSGNEVHVKVRDNNGDVKQLIIGSIEDIRNIVNYDYNKETLEIKLKVASDKEYTITCKKRDGEVKYYLNIAGYKTKVGDIIKSFTNQVKDDIRQKLGQLQDKIELLTIKKDIEAMADIKVSDQDYIREVRQNLLAQGVSESTFDRFKEHLDYVNEEVFGRYVSDISEELTKNNIEFNRSKFNTAKVKGAKGNKFFSIMAIYDLFDSLKDVPTLGRHDNDALKRIFGINGILDAVNDVRESLSSFYMRSDGSVVTRIRPNSAMGRVFRKPSTRKAFVKVISNPVVEGITFATVAYQFGHNIDAIVKGDHHPLNYYFATSNGIKLASMSMKPISMGVGAAVKGLSAATKILRVISTVSKVLGKLSVATAVVDFAVTISITIYETTEYVKAIAGKIPLSDIEQVTLSLERILREFSLLYLVIQEIAGNKPLGQHYENIIKIKSYLDHIKKAAEKILRENSNIAAVVQYVNSIEEKYSEVIKFEGGESCDQRLDNCNTGEICKFEKKYGDIAFSSISRAVNLISLDISKVLPLKHSTLDGKEVYLIDEDIKHLPNITLDEYNNGLRVVSVPFHFHENSPTCSGVINKEYISNEHYFRPQNNKCNSDKVYRECTQTFTLSGRPFIFANERASILSPILYLSGPNQLIAVENYPAVMHVPKGRVDYEGSKYHDNTFIINYDTYGHIRGGAANNTIVMNYNTSTIFVGLHDGIIDIAGSRITLVNVPSGYIYNYISHSTANQNITTGCKTRYVDAGKGGGNNTIKNSDVNCQDKDYEIRKVNGKDVHSRSTKQATFIIDQNSGSGATISFGDLKSKENLDVIYVKSFDISQLRINEHQNGYRLNFVTDEEVKASVRIDSFEKLVTNTKSHK